MPKDVLLILWFQLSYSVYYLLALVLIRLTERERVYLLLYVISKENLSKTPRKWAVEKKCEVITLYRSL